MTSAILSYPTTSASTAGRARTAIGGHTVSRARSRRVSLVAAAVGGFAGLTMALLGPAATPSERPVSGVIHRSVEVRG